MQDNKSYAVYEYGKLKDIFQDIEYAIDYAEFMCDVSACEIVEYDEEEKPKEVRSY